MPRMSTRQLTRLSVPIRRTRGPDDMKILQQAVGLLREGFLEPCAQHHAVD